jgi:hypothetical protein
MKNSGTLPIPAVSTWGVLIAALSLLVLGTIAIQDPSTLRNLGSVSKHPIMPNYLPDDREVGEYETTRAHG